MKVSVIGGAGHVGLALALNLANAGHLVCGIDSDESKNRLIVSGRMPFREERGDEMLHRALAMKRLVMTSDVTPVADSQVIVVAIDTPLGEYLRPQAHGLRALIVRIAPLLNRDQLLVLRCTVAPGTTHLVARLIERITGFEVGRALYAVYAPERATEGTAIVETPTLPQLIGADEDASYLKAGAFFEGFIQARCIRLTSVEAEIAKLLTNMTRYVTFALANECHLIGEAFGVNMNKVIDAAANDYPRFHLPSPGPNVGGPCLAKDGWALTERLPYAELMTTAFRINEGMPTLIVQKLRARPGIRKVAILGLAFKANSDDTRHSLSLTLKRQLDDLGYALVVIDPFVDGSDPPSSLAGSDAVILMTPHPAFKGLRQVLAAVGNDECFYVDIWGFWSLMRHRSQNGYFLGRDVPAHGD